MAERRMFAKTIIDSDAFLDMPLSTQALYFHLSMRADDEGFINNPKKIMRMVGAAQNELELLLSKRYLLSFESGVVVIKHWGIHNLIRKDRMKETLYKEEKQLLTEKENGMYTELELKPAANGCQDDVKCPPRLVKVSQGKGRVVKDNNPQKESKALTTKKTPSEVQSTELYNKIKNYFEEKQIYKRFKSYPKEGAAIKALIKSAKERDPGNEEIFIFGMIEKFEEMRENDPFFGKQPFLPSMLNSAGIFDRVLNQAYSDYQEDKKAANVTEGLVF